MTFKVGPVEAKSARTELARELSGFILDGLPHFNPLGIQRPKRLSPGRYMTVAKVNLAEQLGDTGRYEDIVTYLQKVQEYYFSIL